VLQQIEAVQSHYSCQHDHVAAYYAALTHASCACPTFHASGWNLKFGETLNFGTLTVERENSDVE
jgi:hypothetical protein